MSIYTAIKEMLEDIADGTVPNSNIVYGTRNQFMSYPAITYLITDNETLTVGASPLKKCNVTIKSINTTSENTLTISSAVEAVLVEDVYDSIDFCAVINKNSVLEEPTSGNGEETNPFVSITTAEIYYKE